MVRQNFIKSKYCGDPILDLSSFEKYHEITYIVEQQFFQFLFKYESEFENNFTNSKQISRPVLNSEMAVQ